MTWFLPQIVNNQIDCQEFELQKVHTVTGVLKLFFKNDSAALIPRNSQQEILRSLSVSSEFFASTYNSRLIHSANDILDYATSESLENIRQTLNRMDEFNYFTLKLLMRHLNEYQT